MSSEKVIIRATSDLACPWCYVAYKRLHNALERFSTLEYEIHWTPYMIDVKTATEGEGYLSYNIRRWGGDGWVHDMKSSSRRDGCSFASWITWPNTLHAHRLMELAKSVSWRQADTIKGTLFEYCYENGRNISDIQTLIEVGKTVGLAGVEDYLRDESSGKDDVARADRAAKKSGISGVPHFEIQFGSMKKELHGAQPVEVWIKLFAMCV